MIRPKSTAIEFANLSTTLMNSRDPFLKDTDYLQINTIFLSFYKKNSTKTLIHFIDAYSKTETLLSILFPHLAYFKWNTLVTIAHMKSVISPI